MQCGDRVIGGQWVLQQRPQYGRHLGAEPAGQPGAGLEKHGQRDRLGCAARQQPQQADRGRCGLFQPAKRQGPGSRHGSAVPGRLAAAEQVGPPLGEQGQIPCQGAAGSQDVGGSLRQCQRQAVQFAGQFPGGALVRVAGAGDEEVCRDIGLQDRHRQGLAVWPVRVLAGDQYPAGPRRWQESLDGCQVGRVVEDQQPPGGEPGERVVNRRHRVPGAGDVLDSQLGG